MDSQDAPARPAFALCLSGGGLRATFFHLGVIRFLRDSGMLANVSSVYSVSGGSIVAAHMALHWADFCDPATDEPFHRRSRQLVELAQLNLRGRILRRFLLAGWAVPHFSRSRQLAAQYERLFAGAELRHLPAHPKLAILTTSLTTGDCCMFTRDGYAVLTSPLRSHPASHLRLASAVAASSALPPLFPPVVLKRDALGATEAEFPRRSDRLTDAGVFDNVGVHAFRRDRTSPLPEILVVSDASALFDWRLTPGWRPATSRADRWTDIMMRRIAELEQARGTDVPTVRLSIDEVVFASTSSNGERRFEPQDEAMQRMVKSVRTDVDSFSFDEIRAIAGHGYEVAWNQFLRWGVTTSLASPVDGTSVWRPWDPVPPGWPEYERIVAGRTAKGLNRVVQSSIDGNSEFIRNIRKALGETPLPTPTDSDRDSDQRYPIERVRRALNVARQRRSMLWDYSDWASWALGLLVVSGGVALWRFASFVWRAVHG